MKYFLILMLTVSSSFAFGGQTTNGSLDQSRAKNLDGNQIKKVARALILIKRVYGTSSGGIYQDLRESNF